MAKNNGKFTLFLIICILVVAVILIMGVSEGNKVSKASSYGIFSNENFSVKTCATIKANNNQNKYSQKQSYGYDSVNISLAKSCYKTDNQAMPMNDYTESASVFTINQYSFSDNKDIVNNLNANDENVQKKDELCVQKQNNTIELLCLMYHNVVADNQRQGDYEIRVSALEKDFLELKKMGYQCVDRQTLLNITDKKKYGKYVMITFDDGFYGVYKHLPKLLEKYNMSCIVSVVGEFMDIADKQDFKTRCSYMNTKEVQELAKNKRIEIAHHSYNMHHIGKDRQGVKIKQNENAEEYKSKLIDDTKNLNDKLRSIGINAKTYCYPFGAYCKESEGVFKELNYQMTMTCNEKINYIKDRNSLYLIGRINRSANYENLSNMLMKTCNKQ